MEIYFTTATTKEEAESLISEISFSAKMSIEMGYPGEHGGFKIEAKNGYLAKTSGGVIYGYIDRAVGGGLQSCAILGFEREGSLIKDCIENGWHKTFVFDWIEKFSTGMSTGWMQTDAYLYAPSNLDCNRSV